MGQEFGSEDTIDGDEPRTAVIATASAGTLGVLVACTAAMAAAGTLSLATVSAAATTATAAVLLAVGRGRTRAAAWGVVATAFVGVVGTPLAAGGTRSAALLGIACPPLLAALVLGWREATGVGAATVLGFVLVFAAQVAEVPAPAGSPVEHFVAGVAVVGFTVLVAGLSDQRSRAALERARAEAETARRAVAEHVREVARRTEVERELQAVDGFEVAARMRRTPEWSDIPIVVLTAASLEPAERDRLAHCAAVVGKDVAGLSAVVDLVRRAAPARPALRAAG